MPAKTALSRNFRFDFSYGSVVRSTAAACASVLEFFPSERLPWPGLRSVSSRTKNSRKCLIASGFPDTSPSPPRSVSRLFSPPPVLSSGQGNAQVLRRTDPNTRAASDAFPLTTASCSGRASPADHPSSSLDAAASCSSTVIDFFG